MQESFEGANSVALTCTEDVPRVQRALASGPPKTYRELLQVVWAALQHDSSNSCVDVDADASDSSEPPQSLGMPVLEAAVQGIQGTITSFDFFDTVLPS
eukprot:gene9487-8488_t